jgi:hypothetical protein|eukprot:COSAG01_NODE_597_length_15020_cov_195.298170_5_plen_48_part_00
MDEEDEQQGDVRFDDFAKWIANRCVAHEGLVEEMGDRSMKNLRGALE